MEINLHIKSIVIDQIKKNLGDIQKYFSVESTEVKDREVGIFLALKNLKGFKNILFDDPLSLNVWMLKCLKLGLKDVKRLITFECLDVWMSERVQFKEDMKQL